MYYIFPIGTKEENMNEDAAIVGVSGTFERAYKVGVAIWDALATSFAGNYSEYDTCDGLAIVTFEEQEPYQIKSSFTITYGTHER
jgi:peroxiredoxin family protein